MPFEEMTKREPSGERRLPASITLRGREGTKRPAAIVAITANLVKLAGIKPSDKFSVAFGTGDDAGKLRLQAKTSGLFPGRMMKSALLLDLGFVVRFGTSPCRKVRADARVVSPGVVELDIPDFAVPIAEDKHEDTDPRPSVPRAATSAPQTNGLVVEKTAAADASIEKLGDVSFDCSKGKERVIRNGKAISVSARQLGFVHALAKGNGNPIGLSFLCKELWDNKPPGSAMTMISAMASDLRKPLDGIGLTLNHVKGVGYQLKVR
jgi:hypothetical protein